MPKPGAYTKTDLLSDDQMEGLDATPWGLTCSGCDTLLVTEGDFARHFVLPDATFLNLGECPNTERGRGLITRNVPYYKRGGPVKDKTQKGVT